MQIHQNGATVRVWAPAKVNLFLEVLRRRDDGYHELCTLMTAVSLFDTLDLEPDDDVELTCTDPTLSCGPDNLVVRAAELLKQRSGYEGGARIRLFKRIPKQAGLAGGSSDAAATLLGLNRLWKLGLSRNELARLGAKLGSDVAFFFHTPAAWCTGRGERIEPLALPRPLSFVLVCPPMGLSTAEVFSRLTVPTSPRDGATLRRAVEAGEVDAIGAGLHNRLQEVAEVLCPEVSAVHRKLTALGSAGSLMSGSGTTLFALCRATTESSRISRELLAAREELPNSRVFLVRSCH